MNFVHDTMFQMGGSNDAKTIISFGKYEGRTYEDVKNTDVSYCNWVLKQIEVAGRMKAFQDWLKKTSKNKATCEMCNGCGQVSVV